MIRFFNPLARTVSHSLPAISLCPELRSQARHCSSSGNKDDKQITAIKDQFKVISEQKPTIPGKLRELDQEAIDLKNKYLLGKAEIIFKALNNLPEDQKLLVQQKLSSLSMQYNAFEKKQGTEQLPQSFDTKLRSLTHFIPTDAQNKCLDLDGKYIVAAWAKNDELKKQLVIGWTLLQQEKTLLELQKVIEESPLSPEEETPKPNEKK